jgi:uncharacterized membrane protein
MDNLTLWLAALCTVGVMAAYETTLWIMQRRTPDRLARTLNTRLREEWFAALGDQPGTEILAVQTLRNGLMSASMLASTAALGLMGAVTLAVPSLHASFGAAQLPSNALTPRLALELALLAALCASLVASVMAVRFYNHAGFIVGMPVESPARRHWNAAGRSYVRRAGLLYSWGLRHLILAVPLVASILHPLAGPVAALAIVAILFGFDQVPARGC